MVVIDKVKPNGQRQQHVVKQRRIYLGVKFHLDNTPFLDTEYVLYYTTTLCCDLSSIDNVCTHRLPDFEHFSHEGMYVISTRVEVFTGLNKKENTIVLIHHIMSILHSSLVKSAKFKLHAYFLYPRLQLCHVGFEVLGHFMALVVERKPPVHEAKKLKKSQAW